MLRVDGIDEAKIEKTLSKNSHIVQQAASRTTFTTSELTVPVKKKLVSLLGRSEVETAHEDQEFRLPATKVESRRRSDYFRAAKRPDHYIYGSSDV